MTEPAFHVHAADAPSDWVICCDHANNRVPAEVGGTLHLPEAEMARHIAWDPGAAGVTRELSRLLAGPAVLSNFSRLVIDPNRGEADPTLLMKLYDGTIIPGNRHADASEKARRLDLFHRPYHAALAGVLDTRAAPVICSVHSFTPQLRGRAPRPWQVGILFNRDRRLTDPIIARLESERDLCVGVNEPYDGYYPGDTMDRHALTRGALHVLIELRQDLISDEAGQRHWAARLAPHLTAALKDVRNG
ncbi:N-formylglutamate amidohydrolase [Jannaschia sp. M317]|uniref:N-formylglutamate amidohydrolase n=1 Tax=Jannaschia sp. M317 TaxID=2867011 RepID=UPI0021A8087E|nr:N-formylglutamate amidohydrolase [Jannaschia sp. M317]UWQ18568.1 N-formylglutamate amidohydrolase [Jannaschia sp. M317]